MTDLQKRLAGLTPQQRRQPASAKQRRDADHHRHDRPAHRSLLARSAFSTTATELSDIDSAATAGAT